MAYLLLVATAAAWGAAFVAARALVTTHDPVAVAWLRFVVASVVLALLEVVRARRARVRDPAGTGPGWGTYALLGLTGVFGYNIFFVWGLTLTSATEGSLLVASSPVVCALMGRALLGERLSRRQGMGILLSVAGVVLVVLAAPAGEGGGVSAAATGTTGDPALRGRILGDLLMMASVLVWAVYTVVGTRALDRADSQAVTARAIWWGTAFLTVSYVAAGAPDVGGLFQPAPLFGLLFLSLVCTVFGFVAWYRALALVGVGRAAAFLNLVPVSTMAFAWLLLGESLAWEQVLGGALVMAGVYLAGAGGRTAE